MTSPRPSGASITPEAEVYQESFVELRGELERVIARVVFGLSCLFVGAALAQEPSFGGGDGSSCEQAVVPRIAEGMGMVWAVKAARPAATQ